WGLGASSARRRASAGVSPGRATMSGGKMISWVGASGTRTGASTGGTRGGSAPAGLLAKRTRALSATRTAGMLPREEQRAGHLFDAPDAGGSAMRAASRELLDVARSAEAR